MKAELFPFQKKALVELRDKAAEAISRYQRTHARQIISFTAPTGAGKTIIMASLVENIFFGDVRHDEQPEAIFVWLSDSPQLNEQSKNKFDLKADRIRIGQCVTVQEDSFDQEFFDDGHIYFLNTQKLGKSSKLTKHGDGRDYTIWETIANTAREKSDRLYFIIDEAHRGMQGRDASKATSIMQKFLKGSPEDGIDAMPVVIGMSATTERFNKLVSGIASDTQYAVVTTDDVRASGLLKDRIIISYPEDTTGNKDIAVLQAAADEWKSKCDHWYQYCKEQHYAFVNPVLVIQVQNATTSSVSSTNLEDCLQTIEDRIGYRFTEGEVVHTFGDTTNVSLNGLKIPYVQPSDIAEDRKIRVVFFKENLSTGWDCPRAETMMSFRHASDATYIAQLLGRMIRTPMQMHITVDESLNEVHLYLPYFNAETVKDIVKELQNSEGGDIPADIMKESLDHPATDILTVHPPMKSTTPANSITPTTLTPEPPASLDRNEQEQKEEESQKQDLESAVKTALDATHHIDHTDTEFQVFPKKNEQEPAIEEESFDRTKIVLAINDAGLLSYDVRKTEIANYLTSLFALTRLLRLSKKYVNAEADVMDDIIKKIHTFADGLRVSGKYEDLAKHIMEFQMKSEIFDVFGEDIDDNVAYSFMSTTDADIDRQFRKAETRLGNEGVANLYGRYYYNPDEPNQFKIDVILYAADNDCFSDLMQYAKTTFHSLNDEYRLKLVKLSEEFLKQYNTIVSNGDAVSKHNFRLPEIISLPHDSRGKIYTDHLFLNEYGKACIYLNSWEEGVLHEEEERDDFVCWLRNPPRKPWSLCIPYEMNGEQKPTYPDFLIVRNVPEIGYVFDLLEPHDPNRTDNVGKAKGFAEYAKQNPGLGRMQLIRETKNSIGQKVYKRLDMAQSGVREKVSHVMTDAELDHIFDTDGFIA